MKYGYQHLFIAFIDICGNHHGARFENENIESLLIDNKPASSELIASIKARAEELARADGWGAK